MARIWKLIALLALLLVPFGMAAVPAAAAAHHGSAASILPMQHCPEQAPKDGGKAGFVECTMACSAALPALDIVRDQAQLIVCTPVALGVAHRLNGLHPETATPPPKRS